MSCSNWEKGEIIIPSTEWASFKAGIRDAVNKANETKLSMAIKIHETVSERLKSDRSLLIQECAWEEAEKLNSVRGPYYSSCVFESSDIWEVVQSVWTNKQIGGKWKEVLTKPKKKDFPQHGVTSTEFEVSGASLTFDNNARKVYWSVSESNRAVEAARETILGKAFFASLDAVKWTRGSGGSLYGNDEYNSDSDYEGGGGSYYKGEWGPKESKASAVNSLSSLQIPRFR